jgi:hypothetical protein
MKSSIIRLAFILWCSILFLILFHWYYLIAFQKYTFASGDLYFETESVSSYYVAFFFSAIHLLNGILLFSKNRYVRILSIGNILFFIGILLHLVVPGHDVRMSVTNPGITAEDSELYELLWLADMRFHVDRPFTLAVFIINGTIALNILRIWRPQETLSKFQFYLLDLMIVAAILCVLLGSLKMIWW